MAVASRTSMTTNFSDWGALISQNALDKRAENKNESKSRAQMSQDSTNNLRPTSKQEEEVDI